MAAISEDGVPIAYEAHGRGEPIVLLHGFTETRACWHEAGYVARFLRAGRAAILPDARGHGESGKPRDPAAYAGARRAADVAAVLDALGIARADLMGHSMGGVVALATALRYPARVRSVIVNGAHLLPQDLAPLRALVAGGIAPWIAAVERQAGPLSAAARARMLANDMEALRASVARDRPGGGTPAVPLLAIAGALDPMHDAVADYAHGAGGEFVSLAGRNHVTAFLAAEDVTAVAEGFLTRAAAPALDACAFAVF